ncbi:MAG: capsular polysaccharide biosynthesis protein [Clostridia bacterium]|nr:capsular polysaccharide biosynthesis protein [Clostridia bacterium]
MATVDFHTHILPGIDDGSGSVEESLALLREEAAQGIQRVVATPHFYANHDKPERFLEKRRESETRLRAALEQHPTLPRVTVGAEVHFFEGMSDSEVLTDLVISGTDCVLVEMPSPPWSDRMLNELLGIRQKQGLTPIVAHIDRYIAPFHTHGIPEKLEDLPVYVQANGSFFLRRGTARMALRMLKKGQIHLLGSDCHNTTRRPPNLSEARQVIQRRLGERPLWHIRQLEEEILGD